MFGIEYDPRVDLALKRAARMMRAYLAQHERVIVADAASFNLLAPHDHDERDLWLVCGESADTVLKPACSWQTISEADFKDMKDLYHLYEFSPYFLLLEQDSPYLQGVLRLRQEAGMSLDDVMEALLRR